MAVALVAQDMAEMQTAAIATGQLFEPNRFRWVWCQNGTIEERSLTSFIANSVISHSTINYVPGKTFSPIQYVGNGHLVRLDLSRLCHTDEAFTDVSGEWDKVNEPYFFADTDSGPVPAPHAGTEEYGLIQDATGCLKPLLSLQAIAIASLTTMDGGQYYKFRRVAKSTKEGQTDFDAMLESLGVSEDQVRKAESDQWAGIRISGVTGKPRRVVIFDRPSPTSNNQGLVSITYDTFDANVDTKSHPLMSLLEFNHDGTEVIIEQNNGHLLYLIYNAQEKLVDEAPPNLVSDTTVPDPHGKRLQSAISCIRCHGLEKQLGWRDFTNDVPILIGLGGLDIVADATAAKLGIDQEDAVQMIARLYQSDLQKPIRRAREDQAEAILVSTFGAKTKDGGPWTYTEMSRELAILFENYHYNSVGPIEACRDLGYLVEDKSDANVLFNILMGFNSQITAGFIPEDFRIGVIRQGNKISRRDWLQVYVDAANRAKVNQKSVVSKLLSDVEDSE